MGGKSCVGSMGSSFDVWIAGVGQNAGVESTLMVVSPLKSRMGETGVKEVIEYPLRSRELIKVKIKNKFSIYIFLIVFFQIFIWKRIDSSRKKRIKNVGGDEHPPYDPL